MSEPNLYGDDLFGSSAAPKPTGPVAQRFGFPPFSVLDARAGDWQERKRAWRAIGIKSEVGRGDALTFRLGDDFMGAKNGEMGATSIFDPTLCELCYRWFTPEGGQVVDPFAGGSVRGIVAGMLGRRYWGCDLRAEQVEENRTQAIEIAPAIVPEWIAGDARAVLELSPPADLLFSCPPYGDLERYSDDPRDLSTMVWREFLIAYRDVVARGVARMRTDAFAIFVVSDFRDERGYFRNFVAETSRAFLDAGCAIYNDAVLVRSVGTASLRVSKQFRSARKLARTHDNVLIFCKGDWRVATAKLGILGGEQEEEET